MKLLIDLRWWLLGLAFLCPLMWAGTYVLPYGVRQNLPLDAALFAAAPLQVLGVFAMSRHLAERGGLAIGLGYAAALLWIVALIGMQMAVQAGPGGLLYGFIALAAVGLAGVLQAVTLVLLAFKARA